MCAYATMARLIEEDRILWPQKPSGRPRLKKFLDDAKNLDTGFSSWLEDVGHNTEGTRVIQDLFGDKVFPFSKPLSLLSRLVEQGTPDGTGIVLDFFAGSGTTAHAIYQVNETDGGTRRCILVQLPEPTERQDYSTIADITKERLRRSARKIRGENLLFDSDLGFRVFKLASSNIQAWEPDSEDIPKSLQESITHLKTDRTEDDILFEVLLKLGLDLTVPIEKKQIAGKAVHSVGAGTLIVCLALQIATSEVETLALGIVGLAQDNWPPLARRTLSSVIAPSPTTWPKPTSRPFSSSTGYDKCAAFRTTTMKLHFEA